MHSKLKHDCKYITYIKRKLLFYLFKTREEREKCKRNLNFV